MAILILQERGKLRIHDPICTYLSPCPQAWQPITISQLLTHSSGIPNHFERDGINLVHLEKEPLDFKPGTQFTYSNSGYVVLATIIEKVSGESARHVLAAEYLCSFAHDAYWLRFHPASPCGYGNWI